jgi:hypothetical protein
MPPEKRHFMDLYGPGLPRMAIGGKILAKALQSGRFS